VLNEGVSAKVEAARQEQIRLEDGLRHTMEGERKEVQGRQNDHKLDLDKPESEIWRERHIEDRS